MMLLQTGYINTAPLFPELISDIKRPPQQPSNLHLQIISQLFEHMMEALPPTVKVPPFTRATFKVLAKNLEHNQHRLSALLQNCFHYPQPAAQETAVNICIKVFFFSTLIRQMTTLLKEGPVSTQVRHPDRDKQFDIDRSIYLVYLCDEIIDRVVIDRSDTQAAAGVITTLEKIISDADEKFVDKAELIAQALIQNQGLLLVTITTLLSCEPAALNKLPEFVQAHYAPMIRLFSLVRLTDDLIDKQIDTENQAVNIFTAPANVKNHFLRLQALPAGDPDYQRLRRVRKSFTGHAH